MDIFTQMNIITRKMKLTSLVVLATNFIFIQCDLSKDEIEWLKDGRIYKLFEKYIKANPSGVKLITTADEFVNFLVKTSNETDSHRTSETIDRQNINNQASSSINTQYNDSSAVTENAGHNLDINSMPNKTVENSISNRETQNRSQTSNIKESFSTNSTTQEINKKRPSPSEEDLEIQLINSFEPKKSDEPIDSVKKEEEEDSVEPSSDHQYQSPRKIFSKRVYISFPYSSVVTTKKTNDNSGSSKQDITNLNFHEATKLPFGEKLITKKRVTKQKIDLSEEEIEGEHIKDSSSAQKNEADVLRNQAGYIIGKMPFGKKLIIEERSNDSVNHSTEAVIPNNEQQGLSEGEIQKMLMWDAETESHPTESGINLADDKIGYNHRQQGISGARTESPLTKAISIDVNNYAEVLDQKKNQEVQNRNEAFSIEVRRYSSSDSQYQIPRKMFSKRVNIPFPLNRVVTNKTANDNSETKEQSITNLDFYEATKLPFGEKLIVKKQVTNQETGHSDDEIEELSTKLHSDGKEMENSPSVHNNKKVVLRSQAGNITDELPFGKKLIIGEPSTNFVKYSSAATINNNEQQGFSEDEIQQILMWDAETESPPSKSEIYFANDTIEYSQNNKSGSSEKSSNQYTQYPAKSVQQENTKEGAVIITGKFPVEENPIHQEPINNSMRNSMETAKLSSQQQGLSEDEIQQIVMWDTETQSPPTIRINPNDKIRYNHSVSQDEMQDPLMRSGKTESALTKMKNLVNGRKKEVLTHDKSQQAHNMDEVISIDVGRYPKNLNQKKDQEFQNKDEAFSIDVRSNPTFIFENLTSIIVPPPSQGSVEPNSSTEYGLSDAEINELLMLDAITEPTPTKETLETSERRIKNLENEEIWKPVPNITSKAPRDEQNGLSDEEIEEILRLDMVTRRTPSTSVESKRNLEEIHSEQDMKEILANMELKKVLKEGFESMKLSPLSKHAERSQNNKSRSSEKLSSQYTNYPELIAQQESMKNSAGIITGKFPVGENRINEGPMNNSIKTSMETTKASSHQQGLSEDEIQQILMWDATTESPPSKSEINLANDKIEYSQNNKSRSSEKSSSQYSNYPGLSAQTENMKNSAGTISGKFPVGENFINEGSMNNSIKDSMETTKPSSQQQGLSQDEIQQILMWDAETGSPSTKSEINVAKETLEPSDRRIKNLENEEIWKPVPNITSEAPSDEQNGLSDEEIEEILRLDMVTGRPPLANEESKRNLAEINSEQDMGEKLANIEERKGFESMKLALVSKHAERSRNNKSISSEQTSSQCTNYPAQIAQQESMKNSAGIISGKSAVEENPINEGPINISMENSMETTKPSSQHQGLPEDEIRKILMWDAKTESPPTKSEINLVNDTIEYRQNNKSRASGKSSIQYTNYLAQSVQQENMKDSVGIITGKLPVEGNSINEEPTPSLEPTDRIKNFENEEIWKTVPNVTSKAPTDEQNGLSDEEIEEILRLDMVTRRTPFKNEESKRNLEEIHSEQDMEEKLASIEVQKVLKKGFESMKLAPVSKHGDRLVYNLSRSQQDYHDVLKLTDEELEDVFGLDEMSNVQKPHRSNKRNIHCNKKKPKNM